MGAMLTRALSFLSFSTKAVPELGEFKLAVLRKLRTFHDESIPDECTLASLTQRRMAVAKTMCGHLGGNVNIEPPFFITWGCNTFIGHDVYINRG
jgi:maltose O-acetyltransferase